MPKKLRIATFVTSLWPIPQPAKVIFAPIPLCHEISEGLAKRGHDVTIFGPKGSKAKYAKVRTLNLEPFKMKPPAKIVQNAVPTFISKMVTIWDQRYLSEIYKEAKEGQYDIVYIHVIENTLPFAYMTRNVPTVYSLHDPIVSWRQELYSTFSSPNQYFIPISNAQKRMYPKLKYTPTIYHGLRIEEYPFSDKHQGYLLYAGRIYKEKGVIHAVNVAKKTGHKLIMIGSTDSGYYWEKVIRPKLGKDIEYCGLASGDKLKDYYKNAKALLLPIEREEPFGLVMIEAMATGTPVIAFNRGSVPEVIKDGKTGFIVKNEAEMAKAVMKLDQIKRKDCRARVEKMFTTERMIDSYEKTFCQIVKNFKK